MKSDISIGKITKLDIVKANRVVSRNIELENTIGWISITKAHKTSKNYNRKSKHKKNLFTE